MFALNSEDFHESSRKGKPRSPQSQGASLISNPRALPSIACSTSNLVPSGTSRRSPILGDPLAMAIPAGSSRLSVSASSSSSSATTSNTAAPTAAKKPRALSEPAATLKSFSSVMSIPAALNISIGRASLKDYKRVAHTLALAFEDDPFMNYILNTAHITKDKVSKSTYKKKKLDLLLAYFEYSVYECLSINGTIFVIKDNTTEALLGEMGINKKLNFPYLGVSLWNHIYGSGVDTGYSSGGSSVGSGSESDEDMSDDEYFASEKIGFRSSIHPSFFKFNYLTFRGNCRTKILKDKLPFLTKVRNKVLIDQLIKRENGRDLDIWYLSDIATLPSMRGKGLGKILIQYVINEHINKLCSKAFVYLESSNPVNRKFYSKLGFELMTTFSIKYKKYVDSHKVVKSDPDNKAINMDSMVFFPESATISPPTI